MKKLAIVSFLFIIVMAVSCNNKNNVLSSYSMEEEGATNNGGSNSGGGSNNGGSDNNNNGGSNNGGSDNNNGGGSDNGYVDNPSLGTLYTVVTPKIYVDNTWGTEWKVRERDYDRINYIWGQILKTYDGDSQGLGVVFGPGAAMGFPGHPDLSGASSYTSRLYHEANTNNNWDFKQPFNKYSTDNSPQVPRGAQVKRFKYAVLVQIEDDAYWKNTAWKGKYTIGGVYTAMSRNAYGGEHANQYQDAGKDEIVVVRQDCVLQTDWNTGTGINFYQIQLLFSKSKNTLAQNYIYRYSDFGNIATGPARSIYLAAIPGKYAKGNHW